MKTKPSVHNYYYKFFLVILSITFSIYIYFVLKHTINFPFYDDYYAVLEYILNFNKEESSLNKLLLLFSQHNEHRILLDRILIVLDYFFFGEINFILLTFLGNLSLVAITLLVFRSSTIKKTDAAFLYLIPSIFLIINLTYWELSFWAMASIQNFGVIALAFASLYLLFKCPNKIYYAILLAFMATFSSGNGMMVFYAGILLLLLNKQWGRAFWIWTGAGILSTALYFYDFSKPSNTSFIFENILNDPSVVFLYGLTFIGAFFRSYTALYAGFIMACLLFFLIYKKYYRVNPTIAGFIVFILFTVIPLSIARSFLGIDQASSSRYAINSVVLIACIYFALIELNATKLKLWYLPLLIGISLYFHIRNYEIYLPRIVDKKNNFEIAYAKAKVDKEKNTEQLIPKELLNSKEILFKADSMGIFECSAIPPSNLK